MFTKKEFESLDDVREYIKDSIKSLRYYIVEEAQRFDTELDKVINASKEDIPKLVNVETEAAQEMLKARFKGKDDPEDLEPFLDVLYNSRFDSKDYKALGTNNGQLTEMASMANKLGMEKEASRAYAAIY